MAAGNVHNVHWTPGVWFVCSPRSFLVDHRNSQEQSLGTVDLLKTPTLLAMGTKERSCTPRKHEDHGSVLLFLLPEMLPC
jgi:hypothetical protein